MRGLQPTDGPHDVPDAPRSVSRRIRELFEEAGDAWIADDAPRLSAALAFYSVLSLIPFLIVVISVAASVFGQKAAQGELRWELQELIGAEGAQAIQGLLQSAYTSAATATVLGAITLVFGATAVIMELRDALNTIWHVPAVANSSSAAKLLQFIRERFYLFGLILIAGVFLLASMAMNVLIAVLNKKLGGFLPISPTVLHLIIFVLSFIVVSGLFAVIYRFVPDVKLRWSDVIVGSSFTSLVFTLGKQILGMYLGTANFGSTYGAAGSLVILLVWMYYSAQLFFFGAEFTKVYARSSPSVNRRACV